MGIFSELLGPATELIGKFIPDKDKAAQLAHDLSTMADKMSHQETMAQIKVNEKEAEHPSVFVSGWRPFFGWVCSVGFLNNFLIVPYASLLFPTLTPMDWAAMSPVVMGLLGLGGMRTTEKIKQVARSK